MKHFSMLLRVFAGLSRSWQSTFDWPIVLYWRPKESSLFLEKIYTTMYRGSHFIFEHPQIPELVNLQEKNGKAKPYQIRQFLQLVEQYDLELGD